MISDSSSSGRSSPTSRHRDGRDRRACRSSGCRSRNIRTSCRRRSRSPPAIPAPARGPSSTPSRCRSSSRSTASRTCSTCSPTSATDGSYTLTVTFGIGIDLNFAQVLVQNRVSSALAQLPQAVQAQGVIMQQKSTAILDVRDPDVAGLPLRQPLPRATTPPSISRTSSPACPASATSTSSAPANMRCGCGSTRTSCRRAPSPRRTSSTRSRSKTSRSPPASSACRRRRRRSRSSTRVDIAGRLDDPRSSRTSSSRPASDGQMTVFAMSPASSSAPRPTARCSRSTASRPPASASIRRSRPTRSTLRAR